MTQIQNDVLTVISTLDIDNNKVIITGQLDRKLYLAVNKVLERIGGKWNRKSKAHVFDSDPTDRLNNVIESGVLDPKIKTGYFPTPPIIVDKMINLANLERGQLILEPSAGQGHIADKICDTIKLQHCQIMVCEILSENKHILDEKGYKCEALEFIEFAEECKRLDIKFDRIVMNPPFERQSDITHVTTAFDLLEPKGILVTIMSFGVTFRENKKTVEFRESVMKPNCTYLEHLPDGSFKESGTMVNTILLRLEK